MSTDRLNHPPPSIPDHELLEPVGKGSYGEVWLARNVLGTRRAVKIVRRDSFNNPRPFEREFAGIQRFEPVSRSHEGFVDILQVGRHESAGFFYYVMELADAVTAPDAKGYAPRTLAADLARLKHLPAAECVAVFHSLALALAHLHRAGLVHRDIKPANIIFVEGVAKIADIGLVASADDSRSYVGTEGYIPPEGAGTVGADLYSLGKVLYEAATGLDRNDFPRLPAEAGDLATSAGLLELNVIWLKACANAPEDRYASADEMAADLALLQAGRSVKRLRVVESRLRQTRQVLAVLGLVAVFALGVGLFARRQAARERENRERAEGLQRRAEQAEHDAQDKLGESRIAQARALLQSGEMGRRSAVLALLTNPVSPRLRVEARSLAAAALALPDLVPAPGASIETPAGPVADPQADGTIVVRATRGGATVATLAAREGVAHDPLTFSEDGRFLYAGYGQFTERIWDTRDAREIVRLDTNYYALAFRPGHQQVAVAYVDGRLALHNLPDWSLVQVWINVVEEGRFRWSPDGSRMLLAQPGNALKVLNVEDDQITSLGVFDPIVQVAFWHPDGKHLAIGTGDGYVHVRDLSSWPDFLRLTRHAAQMIQGVFLPPYPWLLTSSWDGTSRLWDWQAGQELGRIEATGYDLAYFATNRLLRWRLGSEPDTHLWRLTGGDVWRQLFYGDPRQNGGPFMVSFSADGRRVAAPCMDGVRVWDSESAREILLLPGYSQAACLLPSGDELVAIIEGKVGRWKLTATNGGRLAATCSKILGQIDPFAKLAVSTNSVIAWLDETWVHGQAAGTNFSWRHGQEMAETLAVSPDGQKVAVGTRNHVGARIFDLAGRLLWRTDIGHGTHLAFSADSQRLAIGTESGVQVFAAADGSSQWRRGPEASREPTFWEVAFSPDGKLVAWTPKPSQVQLLDARDGREVMTLEYPTRRYITRLAFSEDGRWLAEASNTHVVHLWDLPELRRQLQTYRLDWE